MSYKITQYTDGTVVTRDGSEIYRSDGEGHDRDEIADAILDDANFGNPQKAALRALMGLLDVDTADQKMP